MYKDVGKRIMALLLSVCMIAGMVDLSGFTVRAAGEYLYIKVEVDSSFVPIYTGEAIEVPDNLLSVKGVLVDDDGNKTEELISSDNYTVDYGKTNIEAGTATVTVTVVGYDAAKATFKIARKNISDSEIMVEPIETVYALRNGTYRVQPKLKFNGKDIPSSQYTCTYEPEPVLETGENNKRIKITVTGNDDGNFTGARDDIFYDIERMDSKKLTLELQGNVDNTFKMANGFYYVNYTGSPIELDKSKHVVVKYDNVPLKPEQFRLKYSGDQTTVGKETVTAVGIEGKYKDLETAEGKEFWIRKLVVGQGAEENDKSKIAFSIKEQEYPRDGGKLSIEKTPDDGSEKNINTELTVNDPNVKQDFKDVPNSEKFTITVKSGWKDEEPNAEGLIQAYATILSKNDNQYGYTGNRDEVPFFIRVNKLTADLVQYQGEPIKSTGIEEEYDGKTEWLNKIIDEEWITVPGYQKDKDYIIEKVSSETGVLRKTYTNAFKISAKKGGRLTGGPVYVTVVVQARSIKKVTVTIDNTDAVYDGTQQTPKITITDSTGNLTTSDYDIRWGANINAGEDAGSVTIIGKNNYKDDVTETFQIFPLELVEGESGVGNAVVKSPNETEYEYTGSVIKPRVEIEVTRRPNDKYPLKEGDYKVTYTNGSGTEGEFSDVKDGEITMTITGIGNFTNTITRKFKIIPQTIDAESISIPPIPTQTYTGTTIEVSVDPVRHKTLNRTLVKGTDYLLHQGKNTDVGDTANNYVEIEGIGNYTGIAKFPVNIGKCDISNVATDLRVTAKGKDASETYDFINGQLEDRYYPYKGADKIELENLLVRHGEREMQVTTEEGDNASGDYTVTYRNNDDIGTAYLIIKGVGKNYSGVRELPFKIRGNLSPLNNPLGRATARITKALIYNAGTIVPEENDVEVKFRMADNSEKTLKYGVDFEITNPKDPEVTQVGQEKGTAKITGIGDYYGDGEVLFDVDPLDLTFEDLETKYGYKIAGISTEPYPYSDIAVMPEPTITHNDKPVELTNDYTLEYYKGTQLLTSADKFVVGDDYSVKVNAAGNNYINSTQKGYKIRQYDLEKDGLDKGKIEVTGVSDEVVLDDIKYAQDVSPNNAQRVTDSSKAEMGNEANRNTHEHTSVSNPHSRDEVVWKELKVMYTPVGLDGKDGMPRALEYGTEYKVTYENNKKPGTAKYTIEGVGNFSGKIEKTFQILVDLGGSHTEIETDNCYFSPDDLQGNATNTPGVKVTYHLEMFDEADDIIELVQDTDFFVEYSNNHKATHPNPDKDNADKSALTPGNKDGGQIIIREKVADNKHTGLGSGSNENAPKTFAIYQRDISEYGGETELEFTGLEEDGYEYTGEQIIPDFSLKCKSIALKGLKLKENENPSGEDYDYTVRTKYSTDVWTDSETTTPEDESKRVLPEYTVEARTNNNGLYNGNYCGKIVGEPGEFKINPRSITQETVDTRTPIVNNRKNDIGNGCLDSDGWRWGYTRSAINFPKTGGFVLAPDQPQENGLVVTWDNGTIQTPLVEGKDYTIRYENNTGIGEASIWIETPLKSNYAGPYEKHFSIVATIEEVDNDHKDDGLEPYMKLPWGNPEKVPYGIVPTYPDLQFEDYSRVLAGESREPYILEEGKDFEIITERDPNPDPKKGHSQNNTNVTKEGEDAVVVVRGIGNYEGVVSRTYKIVPKDLSDKGIVVQFLNCADYKDIKNPYIFNGEAQEPKFEVYNNRAKDIESMENDSEVPGESEESPKPVYNPYQSNLRMILGTDYEIQGWENNVGPASEKGPSYLILQAKEGGNYTGTLRAEFNIVLRQMEGLTYTITEPENIIYNGAEQRPEVEVSYMDGTRKIVLDPENDYDVEYTNNVNVPVKTETPEEGEEQPLLPTITFTGKGGYDGTHSINFDIKPRDITGDEITATAVAMYNSGNAVTPIITVKDTGILTGVTLDPENDYEVVAGSQTGETGIAEEGTVDIAGKGNYTGTKKVTFRIVPPDGVLTIEEIPEQEFTNSPIMPKVQVSLVSPQIETPFPLNENDYDIRYTDNLKAGTAKVFVTGTGAFEDMGTVEKEFTINPKSIGSEGTIDSAMTLSSIEPQWYGGRPIVPGVELKFQSSSQQQPAIREGEETNNPVTLIQGTDYRVTAVNNTMVGEATATITGIGNYTGTIETKFRIHGNMNMVDVAPIPTQDYTGSPVTPVPQVSIGGKAMVEGTDYRVEYSNNVDRGTATITITGTEDWYFGTKIVKFDIARELSSETAVRGVAAVYTYTGAAITPPVRVEDDGNLLVSGVDYDIAYSENVNAGTATITITGKGKYTGGTTASFKISPQQLGRARISPVSDQIYNGQEQNPPITVTAGNTTLENGKDYSVVYVNSAAPGMASVIVKGEGNYTGTQTVNYNIKVPEITGVKVSKYTNKSMTLSWNKNDVVSGYEIYNSKNRRAVRVNKPTTAKGTVSKLKAGTAQTFRVRAYVNKDGQYYYGPFTSVKGATAPNSTKISSLKSAKKKQVTVKWKKVKGATQYEVYRSTSKKGKYKKLATTKKTSYTDKKATGGKKYYYKIRVCKKIDKKNYYSSYSAVKSVKAKK